jgi:hypothetical protein
MRFAQVLQEVAAAHNVTVTSRSSEIDGYAFCVGLERTLPGEGMPSEEAPDDNAPTESKQLDWESHHIIDVAASITYLIKGAIHRPKRPAWTRQHMFSLDILPLAALLDPYRDRRASDQRDKVFALLGMSTDCATVNLLPDYTTTWEDLFNRLVRSFVGSHTSVAIRSKGPVAIIRAKGWVVGLVFDVERGTT